MGKVGKCAKSDRPAARRADGTVRQAGLRTRASSGAGVESRAIHRSAFPCDPEGPQWLDWSGYTSLTVAGAAPDSHRLPEHLTAVEL